MKSISAMLFTVSFLLLSGCDKQSRVIVSNNPMITTQHGEGPWQVVTYENKKIIHEKVVIDEDAITRRGQTVYLNNKSQFIYKDGTPIVTHQGWYLYWNIDGYLVNRRRMSIPESHVFSVGGKPMGNRTPMKLKNFYKTENASTLSDMLSSG